MKLTPKIEADGLRAYEQVCAFEALVRRRIPWIYAGFFVVSLAFGVALLQMGHARAGAALLSGSVCFAVWTWLDWRKQQARYAVNLRMLAELEAMYGDQLPWIQVEKHFAELDRIKAEMEAEKIAAALKQVRREMAEGEGNFRQD
jgi:hypothetical protein